MRGSRLSDRIGLNRRYILRAGETAADAAALRRMKIVLNSGWKSRMGDYF